jgi:hypothetical protein
VRSPAVRHLDYFLLDSHVGYGLPTKTADKRTVASSDGVGITPYWEEIKLYGTQQSLFLNEQKCAQRSAGVTFSSVQCNIPEIYFLWYYMSENWTSFLPYYITTT